MRLFTSFFIATLVMVSGARAEATSYPKDTNDSEHKVYFDAYEMPVAGDAFHIRVGLNEWLQSNSIHRDTSGLYVYESDIRCVPNSTEYDKHWQCPYCYVIWPENVPCQNPMCPSRYR